MERATAQFCLMLEYTLSAVRCRHAARKHDAITAMRLERFANVQSERAVEALAMMGMGATT